MDPHASRLVGPVTPMFCVIFALLFVDLYWEKGKMLFVHYYYYKGWMHYGSVLSFCSFFNS